MKTIREQLEPLIRETGVREVSRQTSIAPAVISDWLTGRIPTASKRPRTMSDVNVEKIASAVGAEITIQIPKAKRKQRE